MTDNVTVRQEDRDAAMRIHQNHRDHDMARWVSNGQADNDSVVQAFARHAAQARIEGARLALEAVNKRLDEFSSEIAPPTDEKHENDPLWTAVGYIWHSMREVQKLDPETIAKGG